MRAFAWSTVVFFHCALFTGFLTPGSARALRSPWVAPLAGGTWAGVDVFFVLSGFLIGRILIRDLERHGELFFPSFFLRRAFRIFPAHYFILTTSLIATTPIESGMFRFLFLGADPATLWRSSWANYLYVLNYLGPREFPSVMSWAWSLCVEEHFYLLLPGLLFAAYRAPRRVRPGLVLLFVAVPFVLRLGWFLHDPSRNLLDGYYYYSHFRFDELFVGVALAYLSVVHSEWIARVARRAGDWLPFVAFGLIGSVWAFGGLAETNLFTVVFQFLVMALGTGAVLLNCLVLSNRLTRFLALPVWYPLARISYGGYLVHPFVLFALLAFADARGSLDRLDGSWLIVLYLCVMAVSSVLAGIMFVAIEAPLLRIGVDVSSRLRTARPATE